MPNDNSAFKGQRVLVVEDNFLVAVEITSALRDAGATVIGPAHHLSDALALLDPPPDGAVLDLELTHGDTSEPVAEKLSEVGVPVVFYTGSAGRNALWERFPDIPVIDKAKPSREVIKALLQARQH